MTPRHAAGRAWPHDQADGLRRLFAQPRLRLVPVVADPQMACSSLVVERLCAALAARGARMLVVDASDAGDAAPPAGDPASVALADRVEALTPALSYLAARGLLPRYADAQGSTASFLQAAVDAAPRADVVLVHAGATDLARLFARQTLVALPLPLLLADDRPASLTHAYAALKWLALRAGLRVHHLVLAAPGASPRAMRIALRLARCADTFLDALLQGWTLVDPASHAADEPADALLELADTLLAPLRPDAAEAVVDAFSSRRSRPADAPGVLALN